MDQLTERRNRLVGEVLGEIGTEVSPASITRAACVALGIGNATISALDPERGPLLLASYGPWGEDLELLQREPGEGPTLAALADDRAVVSLGRGSRVARWPTFGPQATAYGITALFSLPLRPRSDRATAMSLYATDLAPFDQTRTGDVLLIADMVAEALANPVLEGLRGRLRQVGEDASAIHHAIGVLVARHGFTAAQALSTLRGEAADAKTTLDSVAHKAIQGSSVEHTE